MSKYIPDAEIIAELNIILDIADKKMWELTPEEKFNLQKDRKIEKAHRVWNTIQGAVYMDSEWVSWPYQEVVEYWDGTQKSYYKDNWRLTGGTPYLTTSQGAEYNLWTIKYLEDNVL